PQIAGPTRFGVLLLFALGGLLVAYAAIGLTADERGWIAGLFRRVPRERRAAPRKTEITGERVIPVAPPRARPTVAVADPARAVAPAGRAARGKPSTVQPGLAPGDSYSLPTI